MARRTKDEIMSAVRARIGDSTEDADLNFIEDISDTLDGYEADAQEDWKKKYEDNDRQWREKYKARFLSNDTVQNVPPNIDNAGADSDDESDEAPTTFEELFTTE